MAKTILKSEGNIKYGTGFMLLYALMFALVGGTAKFMLQELSILALVFWRSLFSFCMLLVLLYCKGFPSLKTSHLNLHILRSLLAYCGLVVYFYALSSIPLSTAVVLHATWPVFVPVLAWICFRRLSDRYVWLGVALGFAGVAFIVQPHATGGTPIGTHLGVVAGTLTGFLSGCITLTIWVMSNDEPPLRQMFYFATLNLVISIVLLPWTWQLPSLSTAILMLVLALFYTLSQYFFSASLALAPSDKVNTWSYTSIAFAALIGYFFWGERLSMLAMIGIALVVLGAHITTRKNKS